MSLHESPLVFECADCRLVGIAAIPPSSSSIGVVIVVGGPQYRSGSHRQFTLLARELSKDGIPSLRFDYRGMGDSEGETRSFETVDADLRAAIDALQAAAPGVRQVVLWGLCDAASAALYYAHSDARVAGLVLLNPWVHSEAGASRARLQHYYLARLLQASFWSKLLSGQVRLFASAKDLLRAGGHTLLHRQSKPAADKAGKPLGEGSYIDRMLAGMRLYPGRILLILSGNDLVAQEFEQLARSDSGWKAACASAKVEKHSLREANHTFAARSQRDQVSNLTRRWIAQLTHT